LFHNANLFGSCIIHILYTGCAKIKKNNSGAKGLILPHTNRRSRSNECCGIRIEDTWDVKLCCLLSGCFETSATTLPTTERHVPEDLNPQPHRRDDPSTRSSTTHFHASHMPTIKVGTSGH